MAVFSSLYNVASDQNSLSMFIQKNIDNIADFCSSTVNFQRVELDDFEDFVLFKARVIESLDYTKGHNRAFIYYLLDYCERFCSIPAIVHLYRIIQQHQLTIGSRLEASMLYLYNVPNNQQFVDRFDSICDKLQTAISHEDDDEKKSIATFLNYYSYVIFNTSTHPQFAQELHSKCLSAIKNNSWPFLKNEVVQMCLSFGTSNPNSLLQFVQGQIDTLLGRKDKLEIKIETVADDCLIESNTDYASILAKIPPRFNEIRRISYQLINQYDNKDEIFDSLGRGVKILQEEAQMFSYLSSYGRMHEAKMKSALRHFPFDEIEGNVDLVDWGCGQGLASMIFIENKEGKAEIAKSTLIEPSTICLKRAALHVRHFIPNIPLKTINKDFDSLNSGDIKLNEKTAIHLFSNVIDYEGYNLRHLEDIVSQSIHGKTYFICVSPYITDAKTERINSFERYFEHKFTSFKEIYSAENNAGTWEGTWTRVIRIFSV